MKELSGRKWLYLKAALLLLIGVSSAELLVLRQPDLRTASLLALSVWAFSRFYYFCFYVVERYIDPSFRFSGLLSFAAYILTRSAGKVGAGKRAGG
jgi:hypothetical protein